MTLGTSPQGGIACAARAIAAAWWAGTERAWTALVAAEGRMAWASRVAAGLHVLGLMAILTIAWHAPGSAESLAAGGLPGLHLTFLMTTGVATALLVLGSGTAPAAGGEGRPAGAGVDQLLSQMSHELRTPLNAVIGFSDVMLRELHGPLGHARYQEYAAHISASGGQLLKASDDTLAVTATISALMANRRAARCERIPALTLVRDAWETATAGAANADIRLVVANCSACVIECERRGTEQALVHVLREAIANAHAGGAVHVKGRRRGTARSLEIEIADPLAAAGCSAAWSPPPENPGAAGGMGVHAGTGAADKPGSGSLRMILAGLLLEMQGATLHQGVDAGRSWSARAVFPGKG